MTLRPAKKWDLVIVPAIDAAKITLPILKYA